MKKIFITTISLVFLFLLISCGSTPKVEEPVSTNDEVTVTDYSDDDEVLDVDDVVSAADEDDEEYIRSTNNLSSTEVVTKAEFTDDKAEILRIIDELQEVMEKEDVNAWLKYIAPDSIKYYSNPVNIRKAQKKLPNKLLTLNGIGDYFKYVFIPSRKRSQVKEIRYISKTNIKAVDVKNDGTLIVYYQFVKVNNKWLVHIPTL